MVQRSAKIGAKRAGCRRERRVTKRDDADRRVSRRIPKTADVDGWARCTRRRLRQQRDTEAGGDKFADARRAVGLELDAGDEAFGRSRGSENGVQPASGR